MLMPGRARKGALPPVDLLLSFSAAIFCFIPQASSAVVIFESSMKLLSRALNSVGL